MNFKRTSTLWEELAKSDPLWAICTDPEKRGNKWEINEFFDSGNREVETLFKYLYEKNILPFDRDKALDFGCGAGRLTRALTTYFNDVVGIDVSKSMIDKALELNSDILDRISFIHNPKPDLKILKPNQFSFILTTIVLQHIPPKISLQYIDEFLQLLKPGGILVFQVPVGIGKKMNFISRIKSRIKLRKRLSALGIFKNIHMEMFVIPEEQIKLRLSAPFIELADVIETNHTEPNFNGNLIINYHPEITPVYISKMFIVRKNILASILL